MRPQTRARPGASPRSCGRVPLAAGRRFIAPAAAFALLLAGGCASVPPADEGYASVTVADVQRDAADAPAGTGAATPTVRWGGTIASVNNTGDDATELQIVSRPLDRRGRPRHVDVSEGRFVARIDGFLDPEIVRAGRDITVTGEVEGMRDGRIGESGYRFPVVRVDDYRYWQPAARASAAVPGPYGPYGAYPYGYVPFGIAPWGYPVGHYPYDFNTRFWYGVRHDPLYRPHVRRGGRVGVGVTVRP